MSFLQGAKKVIDRKTDGGREIKMYVAGEWVMGAGSEASLVINPTTEEVLAMIHDASFDQVKVAFESARISQEYWHYEVGEQEKERVFRRMASYLDLNRGPLSWVMIQEGGKLWKWAEAEVQETIDTVWHYHGELSKVYGQTGRCQMSDKRFMVSREPYGVIFAITPWNFPMAVPSWKIFASLAAGNSIVVKAAEQTPTTLSFLCYFFHSAVEEELGKARSKNLGGVFQVLHGRGETVGKIALESGDYDKVMFTGGTETGSIIGEAAGRRRKPVSLELGGHAAIILMDDFSLERAVSEAVNANDGDSGQRCVSTRVVFAEESVYDKFLRAYIDRVKCLRIGNPADSDTFMGPLVSSDQLSRVSIDVLSTVINDRDSATLAYGGFPLKDMKMSRRTFHPNVAPEAWQRGHFFPPTVLEVRDFKNRAMQDEIFGPVLCVMPFSGKNKEEAIFNAVGLLNSSRYGLSNAVLTNQLDLAMKAMDRIKTGILYIGRGTTGAEVGKPFGGVKDSGHGREGCGINEVTYEKVIYIDYHGKTRMAQAGTDESVKRLLDSSKTIGTIIFRT